MDEEVDELDINDDPFDNELFTFLDESLRLFKI
jgi:hypothetical protein